MEKKITLEPVISYHLPLEELKKMYIALALAKYGYLRKPNYNESALLKLLRSDFNRFSTEIRSLMEKMPNDHNLHKIVAFFDYHNRI